MSKKELLKRIRKLENTTQRIKCLEDVVGKEKEKPVFNYWSSFITLSEDYPNDPPIPKTLIERINATEKRIELLLEYLGAEYVSEKELKAKIVKIKNKRSPNKK